MKRDEKQDIINAVVLETGYSRKDVKAIVNSFLGIYQDKISDGSVYIRGFGTMTAVMKERIYFDIHQRKMDKTTIRPSVKFKPHTTFLNLIRHTRLNEQEEESAA